MSQLDRRSAEWFVRPGDVVYDIGAYVGDTSRVYLERQASAVYAFEPLERSRAQIPAELLGNPGFHLLPYALSDRSGQQDMFLLRRNIGGSSLSRTFFERVKQDEGDPGETRRVEVRTLDELGLPPAQFWKIDVEGSELEVLRGAERTLARARPRVVQIEIFKHGDRRYVETMEYLRRTWRHVWALGRDEGGRIVFYDVHPKNFRYPRFHLDLARGGTPHYYASMRSFWELIGRRPAGHRPIGSSAPAGASGAG